MARKNAVISQTVYQDCIVKCQIPVPRKNRNGHGFHYPTYPELRTVEVLQRGPAIGYLVAKRKDNFVVIGWAAFNHNDRKFSKKMGREIATARMNGRKTFTFSERYYDTRIGASAVRNKKISLEGSEIPAYMEDSIESFHVRCAKYFNVKPVQIVLADELALIKG